MFSASTRVFDTLCYTGANVDMAIKACKPEEGTLLHNRKKMEIVKESLNEGYCDTAGQVGNLEFLGEVGGPSIHCRLLTIYPGKMGDLRVFVTKGERPANSVETGHCLGGY